MSPLAPTTTEMSPPALTTEMSSLAPTTTEIPSQQAPKSIQAPKTIAQASEALVQTARKLSSTPAAKTAAKTIAQASETIVETTKVTSTKAANTVVQVSKAAVETAKAPSSKAAKTIAQAAEAIANTTEALVHSSKVVAKPNSDEKGPAPYKKIEIGRVLSVGSSMAMVSINKSIIRNNLLHMAQIGTILKIITNTSIVVAMVSSLRIGSEDEEGMGDGCLARLDILGEITTNKTTRQTKFYRGVRSFPVLSEAVYNMSKDDLRLIFATEQDRSIEIGRLQQDNDIVAQVRIDDLLSKHFAIIGSTGSGKSCTVALVLQAILKSSPTGHVVLFDPHDEYSKSFGNMAEVIRPEGLDIPIWMFDFDETCELLASDIEDQAREEREILNEAILKAKRLYDVSKSNVDISSETKLDALEHSLHRMAAHISLDSPVPYRIHDLIRLIDHEMGKLENNGNLAPFKRLSRRINMIIADPRYKFAFRNQQSPEDIADIIGRIFRIPVQGKPISILDLSGIPSEALNILVSVVSRLAFELAMWSDRKIPILLVCEEAHRYIPSNHKLGFRSTRRAISRIAKEGRKYGVSLGIISQRPSELEPSTLSQCSTIFSMRLSNEIDQNFVRAAVPDGAAELLSFLPSLGTAESMVFGEAVNLPMRVILSTLAEEYRPHSSCVSFTDSWAQPEHSREFVGQVFQNWQKRTNHHEEIGPQKWALNGRVGLPVSQARAVALESIHRRRHDDERRRHDDVQLPSAPPPPSAAHRGFSQAGTAPIVPDSTLAEMRRAITPAENSAPQTLADVKKLLGSALGRPNR